MKQNSKEFLEKSQLAQNEVIENLRSIAKNSGESFKFPSIKDIYIEKESAHLLAYPGIKHYQELQEKDYL